MTFLQNTYAACNSEFWLPVWTKSNKRTEWFRLSELEVAEQRMLEIAHTDDVYFGWCGFAERSTIGRGRSEDVAFSPGITFDADILSADAHAQINLPASTEEILNWIHSAKIPCPSRIIHSGNGCYLQWLHPQTVEFDSEASRRDYAKKTADFHSALRIIANEQKGWKFDTTQDLARVTRMPGTFNHKTNPPKPVKALDNVCRGNQRYSIDDLWNWANETLLAVSASPVSASGAHKLENYTATFDASSEAISAGCAWIRSQLARPVSQTYDEWLAMAAILSRCKGGEQTFHEMSKQDPRYNYGEAAQKFSEAKSNLKPRTCSSIQCSFSPPACETCAVTGTVKSPMAFGASQPDLAFLQSEWVLDAERQSFVNILTGETKTEAAFRTRFNHLSSRRSVTNELIGDKLTGKVDRTRYSPGIRNRFVFRGGSRVLNSWTPGGVEPQPGDCSTILTHLENLIPQDAERDHVLNYLATVLQSPAQKIPHALLIVGRQGVGKSVLGTLARNLIGCENVKEVGSDQAEARFRASWDDCQIAILEEMMTASRLEFYNDFKTWVSQETCAAEEKHQPIREVSTPKAWIIFSNHRNAATIPPDDRRFFVLSSPMEKQPADYYERLWVAVDTQAAAFKQYLLTRDVSSFNASAPPPMTAAKRRLIEESRPPIETILEELTDTHAVPFHKDLLRLDQIEAAVRIRYPQTRRNALSQAMDTLGFERLQNQVFLSDNTRPRLWAVRNVEYWLSCSAEAIRTEFER